MYLMIIVGACSSQKVGPCGLPQEVGLTSAEDTAEGSFPFTPAAAVEAAAGSWTGALSYNCIGGDRSVSEIGVAFDCGAEPAPELVTMTVAVSSINFPIIGFIPANREVSGCESWMVVPANVEVVVESGLFVVPAARGELWISGVAAPEDVEVSGGPATVPVESALSVYGSVLDFQVAGGDFILASDDPLAIVASTIAGGMQKIQQ